MHFYIICLTALQVASGQAQEASVAQAFREDFFVRKIVIDPPTELVSVTYRNTRIYLGTRVQPVQTLLKPQVSYAADASSLYTLIFMGPDLPPSIDPPLSQLVHWLVVNIPGTNVSAGYDVATYFPPTPYPDGFPYIFLLYKQIALLDTSKIPNLSFILSRPNFYYFKFAEKYNLTGPIAGNFMRESYLEIVNQFKMYIFIICLTALQFASGNCEAEKISVTQAFKEDEIVRKIVIDPPTELVSVTYPATLIYPNTTIYLGTKVQPAQTLLKPQVSYEADENSFYTLMFMGPDLPPSIKTPPLSQLIHWLVINIPGNNVSEGYEVATYFPPTPYPEGFPYMFLTYKQSERLNTSKIPNLSFLLSRVNFYYFKFAKKYNMTGPIAGNFMREFYSKLASQTVEAAAGAVSNILGNL